MSRQASIEGSKKIRHRHIYIADIFSGVWSLVPHYKSCDLDPPLSGIDLAMDFSVLKSTPDVHRARSR